MKSYSTTEKVVGKWIDGSDIYRLVVSGFSLSVPANTFTSLPSFPNNVSRVINAMAGDNATYWPSAITNEGTIYHFRNAFNFDYTWYCIDYLKSN